MQTLSVVEREVLFQALFQLRNRRVLVQVDVLVLDRAPEPFHEHIVQRASMTTTFNWNTGSSSLGDHLLKAAASVVGGEADKADNVKTATVSVVKKKAR